MNQALREWRDSFTRQPVDALERLFSGRVQLGTASQLSFGELLDLAFDYDDGDFDSAFSEWLDGQILAKVPARMMPSRWSGRLCEIFRGIAPMMLPKTANLLRTRYEDIRLWLRGLYEGSDRDPESAFLLALASRQIDQRFSALWRRLILGRELAGRDLVSIGMLGFRKMPNVDGGENSDVPYGLLRALLELADQQGIAKVKWQRYIRCVFAAYPRSGKNWVEKFGDVSRQLPREPEHLSGWLKPLLPGWAHRKGGASKSQGALHALPSYQEVQDWRREIARDPGALFSAKGELFLERFRIHARATGDPYFLVRTFNQFGLKVARMAPKHAKWAVGLLEEAIEWNPSNPQNWTVYAQVLGLARRRRDAERVLWYARYRFSWHVFTRNELGGFLRESGDLETSLTVLQEAAAQFPRDLVSRTNLATTLRRMKRYDEALTLLRETDGLFPQDRYVSNLLGATLVKLNRWEDAYEVVSVSYKRDSNPETKGLLTYILRKLGREQEARALQQSANEPDILVEPELLTEPDLPTNESFVEDENGLREPHADAVLPEKDGQTAAQPNAQVSGGASKPQAARTVKKDDLVETRRQRAHKIAKTVDPAEKLGRAMLALWQAEHSDEAAEKKSCCDEALHALDSVDERKTGDLLAGFVETRGLVYLARGDAQEALAFFTAQIEQFGRGGWLGIQLGETRARIALGESVEIEETADLFDSSHARFLFQVAEVISQLSAGQGDLKRGLEVLYSRVENLASSDSSSSAKKTQSVDAPEFGAFGDAFDQLTTSNEEKGKEVRESSDLGPIDHEDRGPTDVSELLGQFVENRWFQSAGIHAIADLSEPGALERVVSQVNVSSKDSLSLIQTAASGLVV